ncbi:MAG: transglycosylase SLT domain-containing protein [Halioglobus sp.]
MFTGNALASAIVPWESDRDQYREDYQDALSALERGETKQFDRIRSRLHAYPLAIYLDFYRLSKNVRKVQPDEVNRFLIASEGSPLPNRLLAVYLKQAGRDRRWKDFLAVMPEAPNAIELQCYFYRAKLGTGEAAVAWQGAEQLWVYGKSRPKECDPLFNTWLKAGQLTDDVVWARMLKAFDTRQRSLLKYVARLGSDELKPWSDILLDVYNKPDRLRSQKFPSSEKYASDIATHGLAYLSRYSPEQSLEVWQRLSKKLHFELDQVQKIEEAIALRSLFAKTEANIPWLQRSLATLGQDKLVELRLRWALGEEDWRAVEETLPLLSDAKNQASVWRYWRAVIDEKKGDAYSYLTAMEILAQERGYYSFLAAERLGRDYAFNNKPLQLAPEDLAPLQSLPAVERVRELVFHQEDRLAHAEWFKIVETSDAMQRERLGSVASHEGWHRMAIDAANKAKAWDRLDLRFPTPWADTFEHYATIANVPSTELMAIARRESAFFPQASSPVGARGLMQLMPATGREVASSIGKRHSNSALFEVDHNVLLGSSYYKQLLDRYQGNRVFALTAYNAGPHRVDRWRNKNGDSVPVEVWIETIPYKETRNYVQAVLSYNVVFQHLMGDDQRLLSKPEVQALY